jgi:hypothetical protein
MLRDEIVGTIWVPSYLLVPNKFVREWYLLDTSESRVGKEALAAEILVETIVVCTDVDIDDDHDEGDIVRERGMSGEVTREGEISSLRRELDERNPLIESNASKFEETTVSTAATSPEPIASTNGNFEKQREGKVSPELLVSSASAEFDPQHLSLMDVLVRSEALMEFMDHMQSVGASSYVQLYIMIETYKNSPSTPSSTHEEAQILFETFFTPKTARFPINFDFWDPGLVTGVSKRIYGNSPPGKDVFDEIQKLAVRVIDDGYWKGFKTSDVFEGYVRKEYKRLGWWHVHWNPEGKIRRQSLAGGVEVGDFASPSIGSVGGSPDAVSSFSGVSASSSFVVVQSNDLKASVGSLNFDMADFSLNQTQEVTVDTISAQPPPLPERGPPPLPPRSGETDGDEELARKLAMEEEDRRLALLLQQEENRKQRSSTVDPNSTRSSTSSSPYRSSTVSSTRAMLFPRPASGSSSIGKEEDEDDPFAEDLTSRGLLVASSDELGSSVENSRETSASFADVDPSTATVEYLAAEIAALREQIASIDQSMEFAEPSNVKALMDTKMDIMNQISNLMDMVAEAEDAEIRGSTGSGVESAEPVMNLQNMGVKVHDASQESIGEERPDVDDSGNPSNGMFGMARKDPHKNLVYVIEVEKLDGSAGWMNTKTLADFLHTFQCLSSEFVKVRKSPFPVPKPLTYVQIRLMSADARQQLAKELERWLNLLLTDALLCQSKPMQEFMRPESVAKQIAAQQKEREQRLRAQRSSSMSSTVANGDLQRQMFGVLRSAGSVIKKAAVNTGNVVGSVGGAVGNVAAAGISTIVRSGQELATTTTTSSWERKLENRHSTPSPLGFAGGSSSSSSPSASTTTRRKSSIERLRRLSGQLTGTIKKFEPRSSSILEHGSGGITSSREISIIERPLQGSSSLPHNSTSSPPRKSGMTAGTTSNPNATHTTSKSDISAQDLAILLECSFGTIEEVFNLADPNQWIRQKGLQMVKSLLRATYSNTLSNLIQIRVDSSTASSSVAGYLKSLNGSLWPDGIWHNNTPQAIENAKREQERPRTDAEIADTRVEAKHLLLHTTVFGVGAVQTVLGKYNTVSGLTRLFNMLQHRELNRALICRVLEVLVRSMLVDGEEV